MFSVFAKEGHYGWPTIMSDAFGGGVVLLPGEVKLFSPVMNPDWSFMEAFDWLSELTERDPNHNPRIKAAPGWRGPQYGYHVD